MLVIFAVSISKLNAQSQNVKITVGSSEFIATLENNPTSAAFVQLLPLTINMSELGGVEKYFYFPSGTTLPTNATNPGTIQTGDLTLYGNNCLVLFYQTFPTSVSYTKIGKINNVTGLTAALGSGSVSVSYELLDPTMGVSDLDVKNNLFQVTPNPATENFRVTGSDFTSLSLLDMNGKVLLQSKENKVDTSNIPAGVYFIKIDADKHSTVSKKVIIKSK
ncbi:cyclophilin-like fold protein [Chryseobacterium sp. JAH]|uniref:cyclophilin-like fold protein n=1 Tax=Chryseobacterium sp. JAH TaxID=1742858 RepID=UPI001E5B9321|nr:cyclophilin-like fold protein [Chryseobacterium sp. JAH]